MSNLALKDITLRTDAARYTLYDDAGAPVNTIYAARLVEPDWAIDKYLCTFFGWRTPTKRHKTFMERYGALGTAKHDAFIGWLIHSGLGVDSNGDRVIGRLSADDWKHIRSLSNSL